MDRSERGGRPAVSEPLAHKSWAVQIEADSAALEASTRSNAKRTRRRHDEATGRCFGAGYDCDCGRL